MPNYGTLQAGGVLTALSPGDGQFYFFNAEAPAAPQASIAVVRGAGPLLSDQGITFFLEFSASPTSSVQILGSNKIPAALFNLNDWVSLYTSTSKQVDGYTDTGRYAYYCVYIASLTGGPTFTAIAQR